MEDPLLEGMATHSRLLAWRILQTEGGWRATVHRVSKVWTQLKHLAHVHTCTIKFSCNYIMLPQ